MTLEPHGFQVVLEKIMCRNNNLVRCLEINMALYFAALFSLSGVFSEITASPDGPLVKISLVSDRSSVKPGEKFRLGVLFDISEGSHIYWKNPGDAGLAPEIEWTLPEGYIVGPLFWPVPERLVEPGELLVNAYHDRVLLFAWVVPPADPKPGLQEFSVSASWLVCRKVCVQESSVAGLKLPTGEGGASAEAALFDEYQRLAPRPADMYPEINVRAVWRGLKDNDGGRVGTITIETTGDLTPLVDLVREAAWFDNPSDNLESRYVRIDREHSSLDRLVLNIGVYRLEPSLDWPPRWGGVLVASLGGPDSKERDYRIEIDFSD